nr:hypothetical protein [Candidatus Njordarchaeota archaeon]
MVFLPPLPRLRRNLSLLVSSGRRDAAYTRFMLLGFLLSRPYSKVDAMRGLKVTRAYLDRVLRDWSELGLIEVRDASSSFKPMMTIYLKLKPVIKVTKLGGVVEEVSDADRVIKFSSILASQAKTRILEALTTVPEGMTLGELLTKLTVEEGQEEKEKTTTKNAGASTREGKIAEKPTPYRRTLYRHLSGLVESGLVIVSKLGKNWVGRESSTHSVFTSGKSSFLLRLGFRSMEFRLDPHRYETRG